MANKIRPKSITVKKATEKSARGEKALPVDRQIKIQKALYEIATAASAVTDLQEFYAELHRIVGKLMYARNFYVTLYDPATQMISAPYFSDEAGDVLPAPARLDKSNKSLRAYVLHTGRTLHVSADQIEEGRRRGRFTPMGTPAEDWIGVPLKVDDQVIGSLTLQSYKEGVRYDEADVQLLEFVAQHVAVALTRARAIDETRQRNAELQIINSVQEGLASKLDMQSIYELVGDKIRDIFDAQGMTIATYDPATNLLHYRYSIQEGERIDYEPAPLSDKGFRAHIIRSRQPLRLDDVEAQGTPYGLVKLQPASAPVTSKSDAPKSWLGVPLLVGDEARGVVNLYNIDHINAYSDLDVRLLQTLVNSMSVALENARLFDETQRLLKETEQRAAELAIINSVQQALASKLDMQAIYELVGDKIRGIFNADVVGIGFYDRELGMMNYPYLFDHGERYFPEPAPISDKHVNYIKATGAVLIHTYEQASQLMSKWGIKNVGGPMPDNSYIAVPLIISNQFMGRITVAKLPSHAFDESDLRLLQTLANSMSVALENARLFDETQGLLKETEQRAQELATVNAVSTALAGELDLNALIELVGEQVRSVFKADIVFVALLDKENNIINFPYQYGQQPEPIPLGQGLTSRIIQSGQPLLINQDMDRQRLQMGVKLIGKRAQSFLGVPIFVGGESIGVVSVQSTKQTGLFSENDQRLLSTIAANVGIAFQNARLFNETQRLFHAEQRAHEQAETLRSVAQALNRSLSLTEVFSLVLTEIQKVIPYDSAGIYQVHENHRVFVAGRGFANLADLLGVSFEFNQQDDEIGYLISRSLQPLILEDAPEKYPQYFSTGTHSATKIRSYMAVPIVLNQKLIGMITLDREEPGFYKDEHAVLAMAFAAQAATAINNARLFDETQQRTAELAIINSVQEGLASKLDMQEIYELVGEKLREVFQNADLSIGVYDPETDILSAPFVVERGKRIPFPTFKLNGKGMIGQMLHDPKTLLFNEDMEDEVRQYQSAVRTGGGIPKSALYIPLMMGSSMRGVVVLEDMENEHAFKESDVRLLETLADSMSVALENARLWEQEKLYRKALERELEIGREIQAGFLPQALPQVEGWEIAASLISAREVAGDFYDAFELPDGTIGLVMADVCDKGVGAALFMTLFRSLIRATANLEYFEHTEHINSPQSAAERLNRAMMLTNNYIAETHGESGMFATLFFGILDPHNGKLTYINGGHEPPLILRSGEPLEALRNTGPAVGAVTNCQFEVHETQLQAGDELFAFTDGVLDCRNPRGDFYGREKLLSVLRRASDTPHELVRTIESELRKYIATATQFDDITLLAVRRG